MRSNANIFLENKDNYLFSNLENSDTLILKCPEGTWITGSWDSFNLLFKTVDEMLHDEKERYESLQERVLEAETKFDKLQEENESLKEELKLRRQV